MADFRVIADALKMGSAPKVKKMVAAALEEGAAPVDILNNSLVVGMSEIGTLFKNNEVYVPEVLIAARDEGGHGHNKAAYDSRPCGDGGQGRHRHGKGRPARHRQKPRRDDAGELGLSGDQPGHRRRARKVRARRTRRRARLLFERSAALSSSPWLFDSLCSAQFAELFMCLRAPAAYAICSPTAPMHCKTIWQHSAKLCLAG